MKSFVISKSMDVVTGLRISGIDGIYCLDDKELKENFRTYRDRSDAGIIILTEDDFEIMEEEVIKIKLSKKLPLIVTIPGKDGLKDKDFILKYVKESVGIKIG